MQLTVEQEQQFSNWQRGLASKAKQKPDAEVKRQAELQRVVADGPRPLAAYLREQIGLAAHEPIDSPMLPRPLDPSEYRDPPFQLEQALWAAWQADVAPHQAARPLFWALAHIRWLEAGLLGEQIDQALLLDGRDATPDQRTRNLLRRLSGLPHVRGKVSVLSDCPIARAWWRGWIAQETANAEPSLAPASIHQALHSNNDWWARLVSDSVHRITVINQPHARAALIRALIRQYPDASRDSQRAPAREMQQAARLFARHSHELAFDSIEVDELTMLAEKSLERAQREMKRTA